MTIDGRIVPHETRVVVDGNGAGMVVAVRNARRFPRGFGRYFEQAATATVILDDGRRRTYPVHRLELEQAA